MVVPIYEILFPFDIESQILTYEEMIRVFPDKRRKRPVVLIGNFFFLMTFFMSYFFATVNFKMVLEQCGHGYGKPGKVREIGK